MKKYYILSFLALSVLILSSCSPAQKANNSASAGEATAPSKLAELSGSISSNLATCLESCQIIKQETGLISKATCRVGCYMAEAKEKKDPQVCIANVDDALMLPACLTSVAEALEDITVCDKIGADSNDLMRGACYSTVVEKTKDTSVCEGIKGSMMYGACTGAEGNE